MNTQRFSGDHLDRGAFEEACMFSGDHLDRGAFEEACMSVPFLSSRRIVVLDNAQDVLKLKDSREFLIALLDRLPDSTALVLIENVQTKGRKSKKKPSPLVSWVNANPDLGKIWQFSSPHGAQFISWVQERCHSLGGAMSVDAARLLAESVMDDPYLAHQEIVKLLDYVNYERPVELADVEKLTPFRGQTNIFAMVDAVGEKRFPAFSTSQSSLPRRSVHRHEPLAPQNSSAYTMNCFPSISQ